MKYLLSVEVKLQELPDEEPVPTPCPGDDNMAPMIGKALQVMTGVVGRPMPFMGGLAGFDFRKTATVAVPDFPALAAIVGKFDNLVRDVEVDAMTRQQL